MNRFAMPTLYSPVWQQGTKDHSAGDEGVSERGKSGWGTRGWEGNAEARRCRGGVPRRTEFRYAFIDRIGDQVAPSRRGLHGDRLPVVWGEQRRGGRRE